jgi:hypothetical protein
MTTDYLDGHTLLEEYGGCPGHWWYEFAYGHYREVIGDQEFHWSYTETPEAEEIREQQRREQLTKLTP